MDNNEIKIFSGSSNSKLSKEIAEKYGKELGKLCIKYFSDGEFAVYFEETIRGSHVFIIQSTIPPADNLMELLIMIDAAKRASAYKIIAVIPYFGFARQDRKDKPRVSITSKLVANMLESAGVSRIITMDLHADQIQGFFEVPVDHLFSSKVFLPYIKEKFNLENLIIVAPDTGGTKRANSYAKYLNAELAICYKQRKVANEISEMFIVGDVKNKDVIIIDDIIDTAETLIKATYLMIEQGANSVNAFCTHPVLSGKAYEKIENSPLKYLITTNSIPLKQKSDKIKVLSIAELFSDVIKSVVSQQSISKNFII